MYFLLFVGYISSSFHDFFSCTKYLQLNVDPIVHSFSLTLEMSLPEYLQYVIMEYFIFLIVWGPTMRPLLLFNLFLYLYKI